MRVADFTYDLPQELIARYPLPERQASRLMVLDRTAQAIGEDQFSRIGAYLREGDLLVMNNTRVIPARLLGQRETGGKVELFLLKQLAGSGQCWEVLLKGSKRFRPGQKIQFAGNMEATAIAPLESGTWQVAFTPANGFDTWLEREGHMPLPPYLHREDEPEDRERYQTVVATVPGAVAAPTAGLHFTTELLQSLSQSGVAVAMVTLHTGLGTFQPVRVEHLEEHSMHREEYHIPAATVAAIREAKQRGGRVVAVGTTTARALESAAVDSTQVKEGPSSTEIFIYPGYVFKVVDTLITNFHLPESTLLMLVSAFAGQEFMLNAYGEAVKRRFRFFSYGDAMLIT